MPVLKPVLPFLFLLIFGTLAAQNKLEILEFPKEKRVLSIEARLGYYWELGSLPDSMMLPVRQYYEKLMQGPRVDFALLYNWNDHLDIGFNYSYFKTSASLEGVTVIYQYANGNQQLFSGTVWGDVEQQYFALRVDPSFKLGKFLYLKPGVSTGVMTYRNTSRIEGYRERISGNTMAFEMRLGLEYFVDNNWSVNLSGSYLMAFLHEPLIENNLERISSENLSASLFKWYVGLGIRYNFTKKGIPAMRPSRHDAPGAGEKPDRFD